MMFNMFSYIQTDDVIILLYAISQSSFLLGKR
jgi:hypothetical protein